MISFLDCFSLQAISHNPAESGAQIINVNHKNWIKFFYPKTVEDLAVNNKKIQEVDEWTKSVSRNNNSDMLLLTGPVGCGKTATLRMLADKYHIKVTEWITPIDIEIPTEYGKCFCVFLWSNSLCFISRIHV